MSRFAMTGAVGTVLWCSTHATGRVLAWADRLQHVKIIFTLNGITPVDEFCDSEVQKVSTDSGNIVIFPDRTISRFELKFNRHTIALYTASFVT
jgi:hypothetical protein